MSLDWPRRPEDVPAGLALIAIFVVLLVTLFIGGNRQRQTRIRLARPAIVSLAADDAQRVASDLGAAFREHMGAEHRWGSEQG